MYFYGVCLEKRQHSFVKAESLCYKGWQYMYGNNVEKDESKAFEYYQKAACLWDGESLFWTGFCYANGIAIEKDEQKAFEYYKRSSEVGHKNGIFKTAFCYFYGIGVEKIDGFKGSKDDDFASRVGFNFYSHDCCKKCGYATYQNDRGFDWCKYCDIDLIVYQWTSGNKTVDEYVKSIQFRTAYLTWLIEWVPFERFTDIKEIGRGGFGVVYSATWLDGSRNSNGSRNLNETIALKAFNSSEEIPFLKDVKILFIYICIYLNNIIC
ncbi:hypothetical protein C2G38_123711 [Gigaspora rosea]|uniref:Protein kinase domain-containing protein n=1 Tax=Gigaspora rosea TaxID=44941 RepID=A0A397UUP0_9GLOM|nr:hypothetical protein C2G38_123711 [Gigaspora rosea]